MEAQRRQRLRVAVERGPVSAVGEGVAESLVQLAAVSEEGSFRKGAEEGIEVGDCRWRMMHSVSIDFISQRQMLESPW